MESDPDVLVRVLDNARFGTRFSKVGFACLCIFQFANGIGIYTLSDAVTISGEGFGLTDFQMQILFVVHFANSYVSPFFAALFADLHVGKYRAIFFSTGMRSFATILLLAIAIVFQFTDRIDMNPTLKSALFGIYIFGLMFLFVSIDFISALVMPFGMQQVNQESRPALASASRWLVWFFDFGVVVATLVSDYLRDRYKDYHLLEDNTLSVVSACLMISVFILGKNQYNRATTDGGRASFVAILIIIKARFCCFFRYRNLDEPMTFGRTECDQYRVHQRWRIKLERLILRKLFLMLSWFACIGMAEVIYYKMIFLKATGWRDDPPEAFTAGYLTLFTYAPFLVLTPICECVAWRRRVSGHTMCNAGDVNFRSMGIGLVMAALAALATALFCHFKKGDDDYLATWKSTWLIPIFLILGMMSVLTYIKVMEFCYTESFKGLECFTTSLFSSLWKFLFSIITWTEVKWRHDMYNIEIFMYCLCGVMVGAILFVFIPVSIWYKRIQTDIDEATTGYSSGGYNTLTRSTLQSSGFQPREGAGERLPTESFA